MALERIAASTFNGVETPQLSALMGIDGGSMYHVLNRLSGAGLVVKVCLRGFCSYGESGSTFFQISEIVYMCWDRYLIYGLPSQLFPLFVPTSLISLYISSSAPPPKTSRPSTRFFCLALLLPRMKCPGAERRWSKRSPKRFKACR